jgi:hypothetical protein
MSERKNYFSNQRVRQLAGLQSSLLKRLSLPLRRYFVISGGIASTALGLALVVSVLAVAYARPATDVVLAGIEEQLAPAAALTAVTATQITPPSVEITSAQHEAPPEQDLRIYALSAENALVSGRLHNVNITFYDCADQGFCGAMYNGRKVYEGAAACSWNLPIGTRFRILGDPTRRVYVCEDRGLLANTWVDIFWYFPDDGYRWQEAVGRYGTIEIVQAVR